MLDRRVAPLLAMTASRSTAWRKFPSKPSPELSILDLKYFRYGLRSRHTIGSSRAMTIVPPAAISLQKPDSVLDWTCSSPSLYRRAEPLPIPPSACSLPVVYRCPIEIGARITRNAGSSRASPPDRRRGDLAGIMSCWPTTVSLPIVAAMPNEGAEMPEQGGGARIIDGATIAAGVRPPVAPQTASLPARGAILPGLTAIPVGDNPAGAIYVPTKP